VPRSGSRRAAAFAIRLTLAGDIAGGAPLRESPLGSTPADWPGASLTPQIQPACCRHRPWIPLMRAWGRRRSRRATKGDAAGWRLTEKVPDQTCI